MFLKIGLTHHPFLDSPSSYHLHHHRPGELPEFFASSNSSSEDKKAMKEAVGDPRIWATVPWGFHGECLNFYQEDGGFMVENPMKMI